MTSDSRTVTRIQLKAWHVAAAVVMLAAASVLFFFNPAQNGFYPRCMLKATTGLDCPGCGALRATHQLLNGNIFTAFGLNPLMILLIPFLGVVLLNYLRQRKGMSPLYSARFARSSLWILLVIVILFTVLRNLPFPAVSWMSTS